MKNKFRNNIHASVYWILFAVSILFIIAHIVDKCFDGIGYKVIEIIQIVIEIMAYGMLPGVLVTWLIEHSNKRRQRENWIKYIESSKMPLKQKCEWLASDLLVSINQPIGKCDDEEDRKTFVQWCEILFSEEYKETYKDEKTAFLDDVKAIQEECMKVLGIVNEYQECISQEERQRDIDKCNKLIKACKSIKTKTKYSDGESYSQYHFDKLATAIYEMFVDLKENYTIAYNSEDYANEKF